MNDYDARLQQVVERTLAAKSGLWVGLLTSHTVMLSVAVALLVTVNPTEAWPFKLIGVLAIISVLLVLLNQALTKAQYELIGRRLTNPEADLPEAARIRDLKHANLRHRITHITECIAVISLAAETLIFGWVLASQ